MILFCSAWHSGCVKYLLLTVFLLALNLLLELMEGAKSVLVGVDESLVY